MTKKLAIQQEFDSLNTYRVWAGGRTSMVRLRQLMKGTPTLQLEGGELCRPLKEGRWFAVGAIEYQPRRWCAHLAVKRGEGYLVP